MFHWRWPYYRAGLLADVGARASADANAHAQADAGAADGEAARHFPIAPPSLLGLARASFVEWRYFSVLSQAFHGIVGLALVNPDRRFARIAEGGLLLIVAGVIDRRPLPRTAAAGAEADAGSRAGAHADTGTDAGTGPPFADDVAELCWMHLIAPASCQFDQPGGSSLTTANLRAGDAHCHLELAQADAARAELHIEAGAGLKVHLSHVGLPDTVLPSALDAGLDGWLGRALGAHWQVQCASPVARADGELILQPGLLSGLAHGPGGDQPSYASAALRARLRAGDVRVAWQGADGYAEHSFGIRPLPLQGWEFLFVPKAETGEALVLQTYPGSQALRYLEVCWQQDGKARKHRFGAEALRLEWVEQVFDPVLGVRRPLRRRIEAEADGLRLTLENRVLHHIALLRRERFAVRHFFISEEIGVADWRLSDDSGRVLAEVHGQPCGGELAHRRWRVPRCAC
ncbi:hypothetical protein [Halochromatium salexigens]|uniref:Uncharacterized protein n=1 Tax=Halochromatium salexigens TaxID=49447 RepID=A0AAJ0UEX3_HALSE|nr:hypothetical protein [Halochromatium salexigens]MBK5930198.1 hypothetical protein [Halochromatium salexigens]